MEKEGQGGEQSASRGLEDHLLGEMGAQGAPAPFDFEFLREGVRCRGRARFSSWAVESTPKGPRRGEPAKRAGGVAIEAWLPGREEGKARGSTCWADLAAGWPSVAKAVFAEALEAVGLELARTPEFQAWALARGIEEAAGPGPLGPRARARRV